MNLGRSGPWATPYAHSFCDKFLGALRHTTPSILRQRGSAATVIIVSNPGMQELSDNMTALFVGNRPRKKPEKYRFHRCFPAVKRYVIGEAGFCPVFTHVFDAAPAHFHGASPPRPGSGVPAPATGENPVPGPHTPPYAPAWRPRCSRNDRSTAARHP